MSLVSPVFKICYAYEMGFGQGLYGEIEYKNPFTKDTNENEAWQIGYDKGKESRNTADDFSKERKA